MNGQKKKVFTPCPRCHIHIMYGIPNTLARQSGKYATRNSGPKKNLADDTATSVKFNSNIEQGKSTDQLDKVLDLIRAIGLRVYLTEGDIDK